MSEDTFHLGIKALIRNSKDEVLLLQVNLAELHGERNAYWDLPGGRVQKGHSVIDTLKREVAEETGVTDIKTTKEIGVVLSNIRIPVAEDTVGLILSVYDCAVSDGTSITLSDEHVAYDWFTPKHAADLLAIKYPKHFCDLVAAL